MQHVSFNDGRDLVPLRCPSCGQLLCERVSRLATERSVRCRACNAESGLATLVAADPALGRILSAQSEIRTIGGMR